MNKLRFYLSLIVAKSLFMFLKLTRLSRGTAILGLIALKICPDFLVYSNNYFTKSRVNITGTNGKTTTSGLLTHLLTKDNKSVLNNTEGANMLNGIINSLALKINIGSRFDYSVIETDEAFLKKVYEKFNGDYLLVTNLFEDQTDRFETPIFTRNLIQAGIDLRENVQLILNADEPLSASLKAKNKKPIFFGISHVFDSEGKEITNTSEIEFNCPICNKKLNYTKLQYAHIGDYFCDCGYKRPEVKYGADVTLYKDYSVINLNNETFKIPLTGLYNAYNALGAIAIAKELGIENIAHNIESYKVAFGRNEVRNICGHKTTLQLIKNPAGTNEVLKTVDLESNILIAVNNNVADGTDISWINEANFDILKDCNKQIVVTGLKAKEMADRLKKAGINNIKTISDIKEAVSYTAQEAEGDITIMSTYTALLKIDKIKELKKCF